MLEFLMEASSEKKGSKRNLLLLKSVKNSLWDLPCPDNLNIWWTFGSMSGVCLVAQLFTGLVLVIHYQPDAWSGFYSVTHIMSETNYGWIFRSFHMTGASLFMICVYTHMGRSFYYGCYEKVKVWYVGVIMLIVLMAISFLGYVLPWGQMSFWGCTVITNLFTAIPYVGQDLVSLLWGGPSVSDHTLKRFFMLHFLLPFILLALSVLHMVFLHEEGSSNPMGRGEVTYVPFYPKYFWQDLKGAIFLALLSTLTIFTCPHMINVPDNLMNADLMVTPEHIEPEWYFLWLYAILRSIPSKSAGIFAMFSALLVLFIFPYGKCFQKEKGLKFYSWGKGAFWLWVINLGCLTYNGACAVEAPQEYVSGLNTFFYFLYYPGVYMLNWLTDFWRKT